MGRVVRDRQRDASAGDLVAGSGRNAQKLSVIEKSQSVRQSRGKFAKAGSPGIGAGLQWKAPAPSTMAPDGAASGPLHLWPETRALGGAA